MKRFAIYWFAKATFRPRHQMTKLPPSPQRQRLFGAYYTPERVAEVLTQWAVRSPDDCVLEPGFGGCGFLESAIAQLKNLGSTSPIENVYGCDLDSKAFVYLEEKLGKFNYQGQFIEADFLSLRPESFSRSAFNVAIGNPPYVSQHNMTDTQKESAQTALKSEKISLDKKASLWAYFVLHSLQFIEKGGRCAWVLPVSFIYANYSSSVKKLIESRFSNISIIHLTERLFLESSAKEKTVILLAEDYLAEAPARKVVHFYANDLKELERITTGLRSIDTTNENITSLPPSIETLNNRAFKELRKSPYKKTLGEILSIKIGIVTGANKFFIINKETASNNGIDRSLLTPILAKMNQAKGLSVNQADLTDGFQRNERCMLLTPSEKVVESGSLDKYFSQFPAEKRKTNKTFKKRKHWYRPLEGQTPDAFFSYMCDHGPRLIINDCSTNSSNTIHRCYIFDSFKSKQRLLAISLLTSFSQTSAELVGRSYGSGVLKLEPSEAKQIEILLPDNLENPVVDKTFDIINHLLIHGRLTEAQDEADRFIYGALGLESTSDVSSAFNELLEKLRHERRIHRKLE